MDFSTLQWMIESEEIRNLREELEKLQHQLSGQQKRIAELSQQIIRLSGITNEIPRSRHTPDLNRSLENFIGLRLIQFIGIIVLVIGLSIGVKYAIDRNLISEFMRIMLAYVSGIILFILSIILKKKYVIFSALLFSGGMASLYFTTYAAYSYYNMLPFGASFLIMIALTVYTVFQAIRYNREEIAWLGLVGAYGIPFLISKNADRADLFFLFISLINLGVVFLCIRKLWKRVGRVAQAITWVLFLAWASLRYNAEQEMTGLAFLIFFFVLFLFTVVSLRWINRQRLTVNDTYQVILNNLTLYIGSLFIFGATYNDADIAVITLCISVLAALQSIAFFKGDENLTGRMMATLSFMLFILFIGFNWNGFIVTLLWLLTACIIFAWGFRMRSVAARMAAIILMGITLAKLVAIDSLTFSTVQKVIAYLILGVLLLVISFFYQKFRQKIFEGKD